MNSFNNKWIWVTGASAGLGAAMVRAFAAENANIILSARNADKLKSVAASCSGTGEKIILPLDLSEVDSLAEKVEEALNSSGGHIDVLINNGGISQRSLAKDTPVEVSRKVFEINFFGAIELTRRLLPSMLERKSGQIVAISSVVGKYGTPVRSSYSASKHALHGYFDSLRFEIENDGIDVTVICPGFIHTDVSKNALNEAGVPRNILDERTANGMEPDEFAKKALQVIRKKKREAYIGKFEIMGVYLKRYFPSLFHRLLPRFDVT